MQIIHFILIIISDRAARGKRPDETIPRVHEWCLSKPFELVEEFIVADERSEIEQALRAALAHTDIELIITSGGTGFAVRDITPEVTADFIDRRTPGIDEFLRLEGMKKTPFAALSRGISGISGNKLIINLPGNPTAVIENLDWLGKIVPHGLKVMQGDVQDKEHRSSGKA